MYFLQLALKKDRGKFVINDVSQLPDDMTEADQMYLAEITGAFPITSRKYGANSGYNQYQTVDLSINWENVRSYIEIARMVAAEMTRITGVQPSRMGEIQAASQAVGVTDISRQQSMLRTERFFEGLDIFAEMAMSLVLGQMKIAFTHDPDKYAHIVGDEGIRFLQSDTSFALDDYGAAVRTSVVGDREQQAIREMTTFAVQNQVLDFLPGLEIMLEENPREALESIRKYVAEQKNFQREAEQRMAMAEQQAQMMQAQQTEAAMGMEAQKHQADLKTKQDITAANNRNKIMVEGGKNTLKAMELTQKMSAQTAKKTQ